MVNIPMKAKGSMQTSELRQINRAKDAHRTHGLTQDCLNSGTATQTGLNQRQDTRMTPTRAPSSSQVPAPARAPSSSQVTVPARVPVTKRRHPPAAGTMLQKGQKISLSQFDSSLEQIEAGLGWDLSPNAQGYELDAEAFLLGASGKVIGDDWFVFYNQPVSPDRAVRLLEPNLSDSCPRDDAVIRIHLRQLNPSVTKVVLILTISEAHENGYNFGNIANAYVRIVNCATHRELVRFQLTDYYSNVCSMMVGEIYRYKDEWRFNPVGNGTGDDLAGLCVRYGVNV